MLYGKTYFEEKMKHDATDITILCKVVDNYGDIGFVYRLARQISALTHTSDSRSDGCTKTNTSFSIRIVVSNLNSFASMAPGIDPSLAYQEYNGWHVYDWNASAVCTQAFIQEEPQIILECFQCGRPDWLDTILFDKGCKDIVHIINIDYLTAEPYADDFHCLLSATRSARVQKVNFMPGFTPKTGGLVLDEPFMSYAEKNLQKQSKIINLQNGQLESNDAPEQETAQSFSVLFFSYEQDCTPIAKELASLNSVLLQKTGDMRSDKPPVHVYAAAGKSFAPFKRALDEYCSTHDGAFLFTALPYLSQTEWDKQLCSTSFNFVRGEDSLSRACLAGIPFLWHAYPQEENYQLVKVQALLDRMKPFFEPADFEVLSRCAIAYNSPHQAGGNANSNTFESDLFYLLNNTPRLRRFFAGFSRSLMQNGDFAAHLIEFIKKSCSDSRIDETC